VTSEAFLKAIKAIGTFNGDCNIRVWLCQIAKNTYFSMLKKKKNEALIDSDADSVSEVSNFTEKLLDEAAALEIRRCLYDLKEPYREVFTLRTLGELSFAEIAELFGKTESWARVTYHRSRLKIKETLL